MSNEWDEVEHSMQRSNGDFFARRTSLLLAISGTTSVVLTGVVLLAMKAGKIDGTGSTSNLDLYASLFLGFVILGLAVWARVKPVPACLAVLLIVGSDRAVTFAHDPAMARRGILWLGLALFFAAKCLHSHWLANGRRFPEFPKVGAMAFGAAVAYWLVQLAMPSGTPASISLPVAAMNEDEEALAVCINDPSIRQNEDCKRLYGLWNLVNNEDSPAAEAVIENFLEKLGPGLGGCDNGINVAPKDRHQLFVRIKVGKTGKITKREILALHPLRPDVKKCVEKTLAKVKLKAPKDKKPKTLTLTVRLDGDEGKVRAH